MLHHTSTRYFRNHKEEEQDRYHSTEGKLDMCNRILCHSFKAVMTRSQQSIHHLLKEKNTRLSGIEFFFFFKGKISRFVFVVFSSSSTLSFVNLLSRNPQLPLVNIPADIAGTGGQAEKPCFELSSFLQDTLCLLIR